MTAKKLNTTSIVNELKGQSAFFPQPQAAEPGAPQITRTDGTIQRTAQPSERTLAKPIPQRDTKRHPFEIYRDQLERLQHLKARAMLRGQTRTLSEMVRAALDAYLAQNEPSERTDATSGRTAPSSARLPVNDL